MIVNDSDQAATQSIEQKLAARFGGGEPQVTNYDESAEAAAQEGETTQGEAEFAEIEWEGSKYQVPAPLKDGFLMKSDYTRKTQELADQRRSYEQALEVAKSGQLEKIFTESITAEHQELAVIDAYLSQMGKQDWASMPTEQILRNKIEIDNIKERREALRQAISEKRSKFDNDVKAKINELRSKSWESAAKAINGYTEQTKDELRKYALAEGLTDTEFDNVSLDPRSLRVIYKAMQFDKVQASAKANPNTKGQALRPGAAQERMPPETVAKLNFRKAMKAATTSREKETAIEGRLAGIFDKRR